MRTLLLITFLVLVQGIAAGADELYSIPLRKQEGLPSQSVYSILQDRQGYIWLATDEGLYRYDGFAFKSYRSARQVSLPGSAIHEDLFGRIWYQNFDGYIYYVSGDSLAAFEERQGPGRFPYCLTDSSLFVMRGNTICSYRLADLSPGMKMPAGEFYHAAATRKEAFFAVDEEIIGINDQQIVRRIRQPRKAAAEIRQLWATNNRLYSSTKYNEQKELLYLEGNTLRQVLAIPQPSLIQGIGQTDSIYWVHTPDGTYAYNENSTPLNGGQPYFPGKSISSVLKDRRGSYWFTTTNNGISLVPQLNKKLVRTGNFTPQHLSHDGTNLLLGTREGSVLLPGDNLSQFAPTGINTGNEITYLYGDSIIRLAVSRTVYVEDRLSGSVAQYPWAIKQVCRVDEKYYAIASSNTAGLICLSKRQRKLASEWDHVPGITVQQTLNGELLSLAELRCKSVATADGAIYFATNKGLFRATPKAGLQEVKEGPESFFGQWLVPFGKEVYALSARGDLYKISAGRLFKAAYNGAPDDALILKIKKSGDYLFLQTAEGLYYSRPNNEPLRFYRAPVDNNGHNLNDIELQGDNLLLATDGGIIVNSLSDTSILSQQPDFYINTILVNGQRLPQERLAELSYRENAITINYSILDYLNYNGYVLYYQVNSGPWLSLPANTRNLEFRSLSPGDYTVRFSYMTDGAVLQTVHFNIDSPFWQKWWFITTCLLLASLTAYLYYRRRVAAILRKNHLQLEKAALEQELSKSMLTSIKAQMNPHFFYNALNTIQGYIFTNDRRNASNYLAKFSKLTRMILEMSGKELITLNEELQALTLYLELEKMRFDDDFEFVVDIAPGVETDLVKMPPMIVQPYVENAVKHGLLHKEGTKLLSIRISNVGGMLQVVIDDNGIGRAHSARLNQQRKETHVSFSTEANRKRIELLNKLAGSKVAVEITDKQTDKGEASGTTVALAIPVR
ncbi:MAG: histidine kinase [Flavipsychrobacter sp.]|nr:histidine kinase [Flavipsychrobacter sp.]